jgi:hypothetical protein
MDDDGMLPESRRSGRPASRWDWAIVLWAVVVLVVGLSIYCTRQTDLLLRKATLMTELSVGLVRQDVEGRLGTPRVWITDYSEPLPDDLAAAIPSARTIQTGMAIYRSRGETIYVWYDGDYVSCIVFAAAKGVQRSTRGALR